MAITKYLNQYAEPEARIFDHSPITQGFQQVLVVPAYNESPAFIDALLSQRFSQHVLVILVINQPKHASHSATHNNQHLFDYIDSHTQQTWQSTNGQCRLFCKNDIGLLIVDRFTTNRQIPEKQGVGLARKIGCDIALQLIAHQVIASHWIHCSDADTSLPNNYFDVAEYDDNHAALIYPFQHQLDANSQPTSAMNIAALCYEIALRYYVFGLQYAGSDYGFYTIGSTLAIHSKHYAQVRGFPKRAAGEDFYLLNKLRKTGKISQLSAPEITIASRLSDRVPFGTGSALQQICQLDNAIADYRFYHPRTFQLLKYWLIFCNQLYRKPQHINTRAIDENYLQHEIKYFLLQQHSDENNPELTAAQLTHCMLSLDIETGLSHASRQSHSASQFSRQLFTWFDGFKTLKFIHYMRDHYYPSVDITQVAHFALAQQIKDSVKDNSKTAVLASIQPTNKILNGMPMVEQLLALNSRLYELTLPT